MTVCDNRSTISYHEEYNIITGGKNSGLHLLLGGECYM